MNDRNFYKDVLLGLSVGDALGVPVEFKSRAFLREKPVKTMQGFGTHRQPPGTWSDDSTMAFCLAESLTKGYDLQDIANRFVNWYQYAYWTANGEVFDIGNTTFKAINRLENGINPLYSGESHESSNGNGALMRILPLVFELKNKSLEERFRIIGEVSAITHGHIRSVLACWMYCEFALALMQGLGKMEAYQYMIQNFKNFEILSQNYAHELIHFTKILGIREDMGNLKLIQDYEEVEIESSGYVIHTLEASLWCFLNTNSYTEATLKAVNLGSDTDTTACVTGGLAGLFYGWESIPKDWLLALARKDDIEDLANRLAMKYK